MGSDISKFYEMPMKRRLSTLKKIAGLSREDIAVLSHNSALGHHLADMMIENVIGTTQIPLGVATNFTINRKDYLVPMAIEESSVVAAASHAAKLCRPSGFTAKSTEPIMIGQIQIVGVKNAQAAKKNVLARKKEIMKLVENQDSVLVKAGGGLKDVEARVLNSIRGKIVVVHLIVDVRDAMGANAVNAYCETIAPKLEEITGGRSVLKIISNYADKRMVYATATWKKKDLGNELIEGVLDAYAFAKADPYRAATHNKGVMNGVDAVLIATGNDWRAAESGAHAYASMSGQYQPLTQYEKNREGDLVGRIEMPLAVGLVGGATKVHPVAKVALKILDVKSSQQLAEIAACVGLANNFAALRAMVKEGIRKGHMKLHAHNIAITAGAHPDEAYEVARRLVKEGDISVSRADAVLHLVRKEQREKAIKEIIEKVGKKIRKRKNGRK